MVTIDFTDGSGAVGSAQWLVLSVVGGRRRSDGGFGDAVPMRGVMLGRGLQVGEAHRLQRHLQPGEECV